MIDLNVSLASSGSARISGYEQLLRMGYAQNAGIYRILVDAGGEWSGLAIRAFWHTPGGTDPPASLVVDGSVTVPALVTAKPGNGCITFEGTDGGKLIASADVLYRVGSNSGTTEGTEPDPEPGAWQQFVDAVKGSSSFAVQAAKDAAASAASAGTSAGAADRSAQSAKASEESASASAKQALDVLEKLGDRGFYNIGSGLKVDTSSNTLMVDTADTAEQDNTKPITSAGVYTLAGNIEVLLAAL